jgi:hypothetical protein
MGYKLRSACEPWRAEFNTFNIKHSKSNIVKRAYGSCGIVAFFFCSLYLDAISLLAVYPPDVLKR